MPGKVLKSPRKRNAVVWPSGKSQTLKSSILPLFDNKTVVDKSKTLSQLIKIIFTGDEVSIKDNYSSLVAYLAFNKELTYDKYAGAYESVAMNFSSKHGVCSALPYCALISSGLILKWEQEQMDQIVSKILRIYQTEPETSNIVFHFLSALVNRVDTLNTQKLRKIEVISLIQMHFLLRVDCKQSFENQVFDSENILELVDIFLQDSEDPDLHRNVAVLLAKKLLSLSEDVMLQFWNKLVDSCTNPQSNKKELHLLNLLNILLKNYRRSNFPIQQFFTGDVIKILTKRSPKIESVFKSINVLIKNLSSQLSGEVNLALIEFILINAERLIDKIPIIKMCDTLMASMDFKELSSLAEFYKQIIIGEKHKANLNVKYKNNDFNDFEKVYAVHCLGKLIGHISCKAEVEWRIKQMKFLFELGFLSIYEINNSTEIFGAARKIFFTCFNHKFSKFTDLDQILHELVKFVSKKMVSEETNFIVPIRDESINLWNKSKEIIEGMDNDEDDVVFRVLLRHMMLFILSKNPMSESAFEELFKVIDNKKLNLNDIHWTEVITDLFLYLLSCESNLHKNIINSIFSRVCKHMTMKGLEMILSADLDDDAEESDDGEDYDDLEECGESEMDDLNSSDEISENGSDIGEQYDDIKLDEEALSDIESDIGNEGQIDKLRDALRQELYKVDTASTCGSIDLDDLDAGEGRQLNSTLGEIFKGQHDRHAKKKIDPLTIHFRIRVLDLLESYINSDPPLHPTIVILTKIVSMLKTSIPNHNLAHVTNSLKKILKRLTTLKKFSNYDSVTEIYLVKILNQILVQDCPESVYRDMTEQIVSSCLFLIKTSAKLGKSGHEIDKFIQNTVTSFFKADNHLPFHLLTSMFTSLSLSKLIKPASEIVKFALSSDIKVHKKGQAIQLLITFYNNKKRFTNVKGFEKSLSKLQKNILEHSLKMVSSPLEVKDINQNYGCMFLDLLTLLKRNSNVQSIKSDSNLDNYEEIVDKLSEIPIFQKQLKVAFTNFSKIFNRQLTVDKKVVEVKSDAKNKRKHSKQNYQKENVNSKIKIKKQKVQK